MSLLSLMENTFLESAAVALVSAYATAVSVKSIPKLRKYEAKAQKAAEWSRTAEKRLWDTRYTVGAGLIFAIVSLLSSLCYVAFVTRQSGLVLLGWPTLLASGAFYVTGYMRSFWDSKAKIPLLDEYNEAISDTQTVIDLLNWIGAGWTAIAVVKLGTMFSTEGSPR
ncbi:hypothetical protein BR93DRAFT_964919 [Coniochaeta sp. PMI_546]|nr:hypothetical protein BR93DRAFT_964919 [Coniochaeta sp. PMI_546]